MQQEDKSSSNSSTVVDEKAGEDPEAKQKEEQEKAWRSLHEAVHNGQVELLKRLLLSMKEKGHSEVAAMLKRRSDEDHLALLPLAARLRRPQAVGLLAAATAGSGHSGDGGDLEGEEEEEEEEEGGGGSLGAALQELINLAAAHGEDALPSDQCPDIGSALLCTQTLFEAAPGMLLPCFSLRWLCCVVLCCVVLVGWLVGWLCCVGWLVVLVGWLVGWLVVLVGWLVGWLCWLVVLCCVGWFGLIGLGCVGWCLVRLT